MKHRELRSSNGDLPLPIIPFVRERGGLMLGALDSGSSGPGSSPGWEHILRCVIGQDTLSAQVYKWNR